MTLSSATNKWTYTGNGTTATYSYTKKIFANTDLELTIIDSDDAETTLTLTTDYTVTDVGDVDGGTIVLVDDGQDWIDGSSFLDSGYTLVIRRVRPLTQLTDIRNQGGFFREAIEDEFDKQIMIDQQQQEELDRSVKVSVGSSVTPVLPEPEDEKILQWDGVLGAMVNVDYDISSLSAAVTNAQAAQSAAETAQSNAETAETNAAASAVAAAASAATFTVDDSTLETTTDTHVKDSGITLAKLANLADMKVIGNVSGGAATPAAVSIIDDDTMATAADTNLATAESIKAYADGLGLSVHTGTVSRDISLDADQAITGVGFTPLAVIIMMGVSGGAGASWGFAASTTGQCLSTNQGGTPDNHLPQTDNCIFITVSSGNYNYANIKTFDADGFTLDWTKTGSPTGTYILNFFCIA